MNSLPSINPVTVEQIKLALTAWGPDADFLAKFVESVMKIVNGSGYGKVITYMGERKVTMIRSEETHSFKDIKDIEF